MPVAFPADFYGEGQCFNCFAIQLSARYFDTSSLKVSS